MVLLENDGAPRMMQHRHGPFPLQLTDLHASNIFVDEHCNSPCLIDQE
jgi:hypothetical protein